MPELDLFANFDRMRREMDELFGDVFERTRLSRRRAGFCPAVDPTGGRVLALAYLRREAAAPGTKVTLASGAPAEVHELPFWREAGSRQ